jgi:CRP-like cAMP-binding protein
MIDEYLNLLGTLSPLNEESKAALSKHVSTKKVSKGDLILEYNEICRHVYYLNTGFARIFYYKHGKNITEWFADEKQFFFSISSYFEEKPSELIIEAIEDCELIMLSKSGQDALCKTNIEIANLVINFYSTSLILSQKRMESIQFESAASRYRNLLKLQPNILKKVPLQHIASFLGITQETLSRIRANL